MRDGYSETLGVLLLRTPTDAGPAKLRYRGRRPDVLTMTFLMNGAQVNTLDDFMRNTIAGVRRFDFTHPRTGRVVAVRMTQSDGGSFQIARRGPDLWDVMLAMEVMP